MKVKRVKIKRLHDRKIHIFKLIRLYKKFIDPETDSERELQNNIKDLVFRIDNGEVFTVMVENREHDGLLDTIKDFLDHDIDMYVVDKEENNNILVAYTAYYLWCGFTPEEIEEKKIRVKLRK